MEGDSGGMLMGRRMCWISDEGLIPSSYIRAVNLFAEPLGDNFAYRSSHEACASDILESEHLVFQRCRSRRAFSLFLTALCANRKIIFDIDDYLLAPPKESSALRLEELENLRQMLVGADLVTCSTPALAEKLRELNPHVEVIPNSVKPKGRLPSLPGDPVRLMISNTDYFKLTRSKKPFFSAIRDILRQHPISQFVFVGQPCSEVLKLQRRFPDRVIIHEGFIPDYNQYLELLETLHPDIGLAPLEESRFHSFKSNIKYLDFAAYAIPAIFSDVPPYRGAIQHGVMGVLTPNTRDGWFHAIDRLLKNPEERLALGRAALDDVTANFHRSISVARWNDILARLSSTPPDSERILRIEDDISRSMNGTETIRRRAWKKFKRQLVNVMPPQVNDGDLIRDTAGRVYYVEKGSLRHVASLAVFEQHGFDPKRVRPIHWLKQQLLPMGEPLEE
jgi:glycosyltransferase involved in cell wall biosynthesis